MFGKEPEDKIRTQPANGTRFHPIVLTHQSISSNQRMPEIFNNSKAIQPMEALKNLNFREEQSSAASSATSVSQTKQHSGVKTKSA